MRAFAARVPLILAAWLLAAGIPAPAQADVTVVRTRDIDIPVSSGGFLRGDLYQPKVDGVVAGPLPTVVIYFPYGKDDGARFERTMLDRLVRAGFAGLLVDIRGTGNSPGAFGLLSAREIRDGYDVVEWAAVQPWSDGRIGMWGYSYPGITAAMVAALRPPHLKAIVPGAALNDGYRDIIYPGGIRASQDLVLGPFLAGQAMARVRQDNTPSQALANVADAAANPGGLKPIAEVGLHTLYDGFWRERSLDESASDIRVPALFWSGWDDVYPRGQTLNYELAGSENKALVMGPWGHIGGATGGSLDFFIAESIRWFDIFLRTADPAERAAKLAAVPPVRVFDVDWTQPVTYDGAYHGVWREFESWPPPHDDVTFSLCDGGGKPTATEPWPVQGSLAAGCMDESSLPVLGPPVEATGGISVTHDTFKSDGANGFNDPKDQRINASATAFLAPALEQSVVITGPARADLWVTTTGTDADWTVRLVDVGPDGTRVVSSGWLRASHRREDTTRPYLWHTHDVEEPVKPGEPYLLRVEIWPTSYRVAAGHRLGILVQAADTAKVASERPAASSAVVVGGTPLSTVTIPMRTTS